MPCLSGLKTGKKCDIFFADEAKNEGSSHDCCLSIEKKVNDMKITLNSQISLLMEAADLVCAYVNRSDVTTLIAASPYGIPADEVGRMMEQVCGHLDRTSERMRFYFQGYPVSDPQSRQERLTCVAFMLIYSILSSCSADLESTRAELMNHPVGRGEPFEIVNHSWSSIGIRMSETYRPLSKELKKLDVPEDLRLQLAEVFSNYTAHVTQLCQLLIPVGEKLLPLLAPWWDKMRPRLEQWQSVLNTEKGRHELLRRINIALEDLDTVYVSLRVFRPFCTEGMYNVLSNNFFYSVGLDIAPFGEEKEGLTRKDMVTLRILSSADRIEILRAMSGRVMTPKELAQELNMNPGTVFRSLNSLFNEHLVDMVVDGIHRSYTTNKENLRHFVQELLGYILKE